MYAALMHLATPACICRNTVQVSSPSTLSSCCSLLVWINDSLFLYLVGCWRGDASSSVIVGRAFSYTRFELSLLVAFRRTVLSLLGFLY